MTTATSRSTSHSGTSDRRGAGCGNEQFRNLPGRHHTAKMGQMLDEIARRAHEDVAKVDDPRAKVMFETTAELVQVLKTAFEHYDAGAEEASLA
jgi:hypothetical protein